MINNKNISILAIIWSLSTMFIVVSAQAENARDPFAPFFAEQNQVSASVNKTAVDELETVHPLEKNALKSYKIIGTVTSKKKKIAVIRASDNRDYFANVDDKLGKEGGYIKEITQSGVVIFVDDKEINLSVSNKFGISDDE